MKKIVYLAALAALVCSCGERSSRTGGSQLEDPMQAEGTRWSGFRNIEPADIDENVFTLIGEDWMLITAGTEDSFNTMTASWGALGYVWSRPSAFITVRNTRYTYQFLQRNDVFTLSFFDQEYKPALALLGTKSGRDGDKVAETNLTPVPTPSGSVAFEEAFMVIECGKVYENPLDPKSIFNDSIAESYIRTPGETHQLIIGDILNVWRK